MEELQTRLQQQEEEIEALNSKVGVRVSVQALQAGVGRGSLAERRWQRLARGRCVAPKEVDIY